MPQDLPGFYYDPEKNRYFPIKGPIPGSFHKSAKPPQESHPALTQGRTSPKKDRPNLLHYREVSGSIINVSGRKENFEEEYRKKFASKPKVWRYQKISKEVDCSLSLLNINVETPEGQYRTEALLTGGVNRFLSLFDVENIGKRFDHGSKITGDFVWPGSGEADYSEIYKDIWKFNGASILMSSTTSSINIPGKGHILADTDVAPAKCALISTLGSATARGSLYVLDLTGSLDIFSGSPYVERLREIASLRCTIWGADTNCSGNKAVLGTNLGATLVDVETAASSTLCRSKSDVLSVQLIHSGNLALCGLRNGAIVTVDVRQQQRELAQHRIYPSLDSTSSRTAQRTTKSWFVLRGNIQPSSTIYMPSSVCCLESLQTYDQYFLASSMDGSIRLYDHRLTNRGPVQSYEGHVNSHSHIKLGTDASESFVMSGGQDYKMRIWSIKSGEMLFEENLSDSIPLTVCWRGSEGRPKTVDERPVSECHDYTETRSCEAWVGSANGLLRMQFSL